MTNLLKPLELVHCARMEQAQRFDQRLRLIEQNIEAELDVPTFQRDGERLACLHLMRDEAAQGFFYWTQAICKWVAKVAEA